MSRVQVNLDDLIRDPNDGAYHCPSCEAPFTRRSNLRRHFVIHTRALPFKCAICDERFSRSDELRHHALTSCDDPWKESTTSTPEAMSVPPQAGNFNVMAALPYQSSLTNSPISQATFSNSPTSVIQDEQLFAELMSSFTTPPTANPFEGYDSIFNAHGAIDPPSSMGSVPVEPASSTVRPRFREEKAVQPYVHSKQNRSREKPIYTRRQVDDMLKAVSHCFTGTMEEVLRRIDIPEQGTGKGRDSHKNLERSNVELRNILNDTLPRLFNGVQNFLQDEPFDD